MALVLTPLRSDLRTRGPWLAAGLALALVAPHVLWQLQNNWPTVEFVRNAARLKNVTLGPGGFLLAQVRDFGPLNTALWVTGLGWLAFGASGQFRALAIVFVVSFLVLMNGKAYYLAPAMLVPLAAGPVLIERLLAGPRSAVARVAVLGVLPIAAAVPLPIVVPLLSPERLGPYMSALGIVPEKAERSELGVLPQHFADRFGWEELISITAQAWRSLTPDEQGTGNNNFYLWGPGNPDATIVITVGISPKELGQVFEDVHVVSKLTDPFAMPYEREHPVTICRGPKIPLREEWSRGKHFI